MTVAAAGAAYLWITKIQSMMTESVTGGFLQTTKAQETKFCIESVWNSTTQVVFTMRNCGSYDVTQSDFAQTGYYVDGIKQPNGPTGCTPDVATAFNVYDIRTVTCVAGSYGTCSSTEGCPTRTVKVTTVFGKADTVTYQYRPQ